MMKKLIDRNDTIKLFDALNTMVTVVATMDRNEPTGISIEPLTAPRDEPPLLMIPFPAESPLKEAIAEAGEFCVSCIDGSAQEELARGFAARRSDVWQTVRWHPGHSGPVLEDAVAWISCSVESEFESGLYEVIVGRAIRVEADPTVLDLETN